MSHRSRIRQAVEFALVGAASLVLPLLPRRGILRLADCMGNIVFRFSSRRRRQALANLDLAFGAGLDAGQKERIARESFRTGYLTVLDLFWFGSFRRGSISSWLVFDEAFKSFFETKPAIAVTAHIGGWEMLGMALAMRGSGCATIAVGLRNSLLDRRLIRLRSGSGQHTIPAEGGVKELLSRLRRGERVALLPDQNTLPSEGGAFVKFFGLPVPVSRAAGALAARTGAPVFVMYCVADTGGRYEARVYPAIRAGTGPRAADAVTEALMLRIEEAIRANPGKWLWAYKRWKYIPDNVDAAGYPYYARQHGGPMVSS